MKRKILNQIKDILFKLFKMKNSLYNFFNKQKYNMSVAIISCDKWKNKVKEDIYLKHYLNKKNINASIVSWQDNNVDFSKYDSIIIRSIWGFQNYKKDFENWLDKLENKNVTVFNSVDIIRKNFNKEIQFNLLEKNKIKTIETKFVDINENIEKSIEKIKKDFFPKCDLIVIKPTISESGNDTYIIGEKDTGKNRININEISTKFKNCNNGAKLMVQPFIEEVLSGEYSICCIDGEITHAILRYADVFHNNNLIKYIPIEELDKDIIDIVKRVLEIEEYKNNIYMRVDIVKHKKDYLIMEVELLDPNLFLLFIKDRKKRKEVIQKFTSAIVCRTE